MTTKERDRAKRRQRRAERTKAKRTGKPHKARAPAANIQLAQEVKARATLKLPDLDGSREMLDNLITAADQFAPDHDVTVCPVCAAAAQQVEIIKGHAMANGDTSEERLKNGWGRDLVIIEQLQAIDWTGEALRLVAAMAEAGHRQKASADAALRDAIAEQAHTSWIGWTKWMIDCLASDEADTHTERWERLMETPYAALTEAEKKSDLVEADAFLEILRHRGY